MKDASRHAFPASGLTHQPESLTIADLERDTVDGMHLPSLGLEMDLEVTDRGDERSSRLPGDVGRHRHGPAAHAVLNLSSSRFSNRLLNRHRTI